MKRSQGCQIAPDFDPRFASKTDPTDGAETDTRWAIYGSRSYAEGHKRIRAIHDINDHDVITFGDALRNHPTNRWLHSVAPSSRIAARADSLFALLMAAKSGVGLAPIPIIIGDAEPDLVRLIGPIPDLSTPFYLLMHRDMRKTPRVRAFFDFFVGELPNLRPIIAGRGNPHPHQKA